MGERSCIARVVPAPDSSIRGQASAGTQRRLSKRHWIPAFAGMTILRVAVASGFVMLSNQHSIAR